MHVKICGITNREDALAAAERGADYLGFNFYPQSPRCISPEECAKILPPLRKSHPHIATVGVFVNMSPADAASIIRACRFDLAQLSGDEPVAALEGLAAEGVRAYKAIRSPAAFGLAESYAGVGRSAPALLLDGSAPGLFGGSGHTADWSQAAVIARKFPIFLAGGLTPDNVAAAIREVHPWGVDAASGVESAPGQKDHKKMEAFIRAARPPEISETASIGPANLGDAAEILALQKLAYQSEAELNHDFSIPPLTQTLAQIQTEFTDTLFLAAKSDGRIIGSVRARAQDETCAIGRLIVHPDFQNQGLGGRMMREIEAHFPQAKRFELFTGERSLRNLHLYQKLGYRVFQQEPMNERVTLVYLEKHAERQS